MNSRRDRLRKEKLQHFLGTASIKFGALSFDWCRKRNPLRASPDQKNVASLENMFRRGCDWSPELVSHQIPALIDPDLLEASLLRAENSPSLERLKKEDGVFVELDLADGKVTCLRGEHRVLASDATVANRKKRWIVRLYSTALSEEARNDLADERVSERKTTDAEYFYNITLFWSKNNDRTSSEYAQLMRDSKNKAQDLKRLWSGSLGLKDLWKRFHAIPALFWGIYLGNVGRIITMPQQQTLNQIQRVFDFWDYICGQDSEMKLKLDMNTIKAISGRGSGAYAGFKLANSGEILRNFDATERAAILSRLQYATTERVAPTLGGVFQNALYLKSVVDCLRHLVPYHRRPRDLWDELNNGFEERSDGCCLLQVSDTRFRLIPAVDVDHFEIARRQLWLFALREFPSLPRDETAKRAGAKSHLDEAKLFELAVLAHRLGYRSDQINHILENASWRPAPVRSVCIEDPDIESKPYKHGKPHPEDLERYKSSLFLFEFHKPFDPESPGSSFFFIQRSLYFDIYPDAPRGIDLLLERAAEASEHDLIDDEYRPSIQGASEELIRKEHQLNASISELQQRHDELQQGCRKLLAEGSLKQEQINAMEEKRLELEKQVTQLKNDVTHGEQVKKDLEKEYQHAQQTLSNTGTLIETENDKLNGLQSEVAGLETRKKSLESEIQETSRQAESLRVSNTAHSNDRQESNHEDEHLTSREVRYVGPSTEDRKTKQFNQDGALLFDDFAPPMWFPIEMRKRTRAYKNNYEMAEYMQQFVQEGYSMADRDMKTLLPHSCYNALKDEGDVEDRLIILFKDNLVLSEYDFADTVDKAIPLVRSKKRKTNLQHIKEQLSGDSEEE